MAGRRVKEGKLRRYKNKLFGGKWVDTKVVLYEDSSLVWFEENDESRPHGSLQLKQVAPYFAVGVYSTRLPHRPPLPPGAKVDHVLAFGTGPSRDAKVHWFVCANDEDLNSWMAGIVSTLPPPPQQAPPAPPPGYNQGAPPPQPYYNQPGGYPQQPQTAWRPPPQSGGYYPAAPATGAAPGHTTVVVAPSSYPGYTGGGSSGWGGTAAGLGTGMLAGGLMGYAMGSMMHPHGGWGSGYGYGGPGGYYDNDTTIVNNYNTTNPTTNDQFDASGQYGSGSGFDYGGDGGFDYGGDDAAGGFDDGGGDFDFGGGDF